jgi:hypothetical protein
MPRLRSPDVDNGRDGDASVEEIVDVVLAHKPKPKTKAAKKRKKAAKKKSRAV